MTHTRRWTSLTMTFALALTSAGAAAPSYANTGTVSLPAVTATHPSSVQSTLATAAKAAVTVKHTTGSVRTGESIRLVAQARAQGGSVVSKGLLRVQFKPTGGSWKSVIVSRTNTAGKYAVDWRPDRSGHVRVAVRPASGGSYIISPAITVSVSTANRNLTQRQNILKHNIGTKKGSLGRLSASQRRAANVKNLKSVAYQRYSKAMIVRNTVGGASSAYVIRGKILSAYLNAGGPKGRYGVPLMDAQCGLLDNGCVQQFSRGTIYSSSTSKNATGVTATGKPGEVAAAATSQVGYTKKWSGSASVQHTKFNNWAGYTTHWCGHFVSWSAAASGNPHVTPVRKNFNTLHQHLLNKYAKKRTPKVGALAFIDTMGAGRATHMGIVTAVGGGKVTVIEGNTVGNLPKNTRGVLKRNRTPSSILYYVYPNY